MFGDQTKQEDTMAPETENTQAPTIGQIGQDEFQVLVRAAASFCVITIAITVSVSFRPTLIHRETVSSLS